MVFGRIRSGRLLCKSGGLTRLSNGLATIEQVPSGRQRQRVRECSDDAGATRGETGREVDVQAGVRERLAGLLREWHGEKRLALA
jgi:hypothetical protein